MADGNKVFVSPGVYTSEKDLTFVAQSVGVTTLGLVGETLKGPAFEPIFISSYDDFVTRFGGTSPELYVDSQIPKYELGYIAKSYLSQSNQLFVTRVLGLSGYDAGPSWSIQTIGQLEPSGLEHSYSALTSSSGLTVPFFIPLTGDSYYSGTTVGADAFTSAALTTPFWTSIPSELTGIDFGSWSETGQTITLNDGSTLSSFNQSFLNWAQESIALSSDTNFNTALSSGATGGCTYGVDPCIPVALDGTIYQYGCIPQYLTDTATGITTDSLSAYTIASDGATATTTSVTNVLSTNCADLTSYENDPWYYGLFEYTGSTQCCTGTTYSGLSYQLYSSGYTHGVGEAMEQATGTTFDSTGGTIVVLSGYAVFDIINYQGVTANTEYDGMDILTFRSRGLSSLGSGGPVYAISANTVGNVEFDCSGSYEAVLEDPFATFGISAKTDEGNVYTFEASMSNTAQNFAPRVFGRTPFDKKQVDVPIFVEEAYPTLLNIGRKLGKVRGLQCCLQYLPSARAAVNTNTIAWYMNQWETPETPYIVSELQGSDVFRLFKFVSISDGSAANREYKVSIVNLSFERGEFDIIVRDFYDTDANPVVLEKFTRCSLDPTKVSFVCRKIGTSTGEFELKSKYTMIYPTEALLDGTYTGSLPAGFEGYRFRRYGNCGVNPKIVYKTKYYNPGEIVFDPPYGSATGNNVVRSGGDKVSKVYLGVSDSTGAGYDADFFDFKGYIPPTNICTGTAGSQWEVLTKGFHMDSGATVVIGGVGTYLNWSSTTLNGESIFDCGVGQFNTEPTLSTEPYKSLRSRKFTVAPHGGFDGFDIYRKTRSNTDDYRMGLTGFLNGACTSSDFPTATGDGSFKKLSTNEANTDYFAYLRGINEFSNPESVDINVFATPGIDYVDNLGLVNEAIDMVETDRADSLYITTTPDYNMFVTTNSDPTNQVTPDEAVDNIEDSLIDSNYTATYYPWVQIRDAANNKQVYIPPTAEVMRNIALTDNISFPWFASAGYTRGLVNAVKARKKLTLDERDTLYVGRLNPIATFSDTGPIIWGNKTLQIRESALDRINVRRLLLQTRKLISAVAVRLIFEQNDDVVRQQFLDLVNPILDSIRRDRGLTDFRVVLSNDPEEIDRNEMNGKIYIKPTRALEYIFVEFLITPTGASFEDI